MRNHRSGPEPSPCPLQAQASGPKLSGNVIVGCNGSAWLLEDTVIGLQDYWRQLPANSSIVAGRTAIPTSFLCPDVVSASLLSATAIFRRLAISLSDFDAVSDAHQKSNPSHRCDAGWQPTGDAGNGGLAWTSGTWRDLRAKRGLLFSVYWENEELGNPRAHGDLILRPPEATLPHRRAPGGGFPRQGPFGVRGPRLTWPCARSQPCGIRDVAHRFLPHHRFRAHCRTCVLGTWMCLPCQYCACSGDWVSRGCDGSAGACLCLTSAFPTATSLDLLCACAWTVALTIAVSYCLCSCSWFLREDVDVHDLLLCSLFVYLAASQAHRYVLRGGWGGEVRVDLWGGSAERRWGWSDQCRPVTSRLFTSALFALCWRQLQSTVLYSSLFMASLVCPLHPFCFVLCGFSTCRTSSVSRTAAA